VSRFRRKASLEEALRGHLERLGLSPFWLPSATDAVRACERGDYFQPVFSVAGPAPARSVVALMKLEPFVATEVDWSVSPSESPFWVGSIGRPHDEVFNETRLRFADLYGSERNPLLKPELQAALQAMVLTLEREASAEGRWEAEGVEVSRRLLALGSAGYVWRLAEAGVQTSDLNLRADLVREVEAVVASFPAEEHRDRLLASAAAECLSRELLLGSGSPGSWAAGGEFLRRGFRLAESHVFPDDVALPPADRWYAFSFGVALYEVADFLAIRDSALAARGYTGAAARPGYE
jgi:hypothetical protein